MFSSSLQREKKKISHSPEKLQNSSIHSDQQTLIQSQQNVSVHRNETDLKKLAEFDGDEKRREVIQLEKEVAELTAANKRFRQFIKISEKEKAAAAAARKADAELDQQKWEAREQQH